MQNQVTRFKRERDTYKHMLEGAQKTIGDLKNSPMKSGRDSRASIASLDDVSIRIYSTIQQQNNPMFSLLYYLA